MKKRIFLILAMVLTLSLFLASCSFTLDFSGCIGTVPGNSGTHTGGQITPDVDNSVTAFTMTMEKDDGLYYPQFKGKIKYSYYPEKMAIEIDGNEYELEAKTVKLVNGYYLFSFDQTVQLTQIDKGQHTITAYGYQNDKKNAIEQTYLWDVDDDYSICSCVDFETGETRFGLDKESNWTPFY